MFDLKFQDTIKTVEKIQEHQFTEYHHRVLSGIRFVNGNLDIPDCSWSHIYLGAGEEKAVFCICDHENRVFALEAIDEKHYLNGRFVGGQYFFDKRIEGLKNVKFKKESLIGLTFTGLTRIREFVYGYEWGRFQFDPAEKRWIDHLLTGWLQMRLVSKFNGYKERYKDVHERNVMFEIREAKDKGIVTWARDLNGKVKLVRVWIQPIDIR